MQQRIIKGMTYIIAVIVLALPLAYAATDTYTAVNSNKYEYGSSGTITSYKPAITNSVSSDHRDYMVYTVSGKKHTIGAGMNWYKTNAGSIIGWLMVYVHDPSNTSYQGVHYVYSGYTYTQNSVTVSASTCKATSSTSTTCNPAASACCWIGSVVDTNTGYSLRKGRCYSTLIIPTLQLALLEQLAEHSQTTLQTRIH
ncbi:MULTISPECIES: hypothetical protein [Candidatus Nitrosocaldus]|jgi:hypothetical protein|uniref:Uncharacterized protein n=1 Tax=Candidatus Nitrosocaldus cavascurensis TaxID=2058097 RepID=A0A2K5AS79_9ARCH|nr:MULTISPECIES: hypothetical protein [Candidatus Nitrosocaldus]SPC34469.1 exported protein of unknown function [Candidatus Nitrosocaldus cavascurensis]